MTAARSDQPLGDLLAQVTKPGELYRALPGKWLQCYACGHRCKIPPGRPGICKVRFNEEGILKVPAGYVGALQCDPVEKKPFFHALPGALALSFGMLGCDFHCGYCFAPETMVVTNKGAVPIVDLFSQGQEVMRIDHAEIAFPRDLRAVTASGKLRPVRKVFKHRYSGELMVVRPYYLPEFRCTPDHKIYATEDPLKPPEPIEAGKLTGKHYLVVPRYRHIPSPQVLDVCQVLSAFEARFKTPHKLSILEVDHIMTASAAGANSRTLGLKFGKHPSYIRHVRSKYTNGKASVTTKSRQLAFDIAWLALKTGRLPSLYENQVAVERSSEGRRVKQWPHQYTVVWYDGETVKQRGVSTDDFYFVPIRSVDIIEFDGEV